MPTYPGFPRARNEEKVQHLLKDHMMIEPAYVENIIATPIFTGRQTDQFFESLRVGHKQVLTVNEEPRLAACIGSNEHSDFDGLGVWARFAGKMAIHESGLVTLEDSLHRLPKSKSLILADQFNASILLARQELKK